MTVRHPRFSLKRATRDGWWILLQWLTLLGSITKTNGTWGKRTTNICSDSKGFISTRTASPIKNNPDLWYLHWHCKMSQHRLWKLRNPHYEISHSVILTLPSICLSTVHIINSHSVQLINRLTVGWQENLQVRISIPHVGYGNGQPRTGFHHPISIGIIIAILSK